MNKLFLIPILSISVSGYCQTSISCGDLKSGIFYIYPKNTKDKYLVYRSDEFQKEINLVTGDTAVWKIEWGNKCSYSLKLQSSNMKMSAELEKLLKHHKFIFSISTITNDYYTFKGALDNITNPQLIADTIWLKEKLDIKNSELFRLVENENEVKRLNDTSNYALLYIYRPGKISNSLGNYFIYFDNVLMCVANNNTGYIFKILKEGTFQLSSKLYKDESSVAVDIKFGKTYYVKSMIHWGITSRLYNFKLEMATVPAQVGQTEFENIKHK